MICPRCEKDVDCVRGQGTFPNRTYRCDRCDSKEWAEVVITAIVLFGGMFAFAAIFA